MSQVTPSVAAPPQALTMLSPPPPPPTVLPPPPAPPLVAPSSYTPMVVEHPRPSHLGLPVTLTPGQPSHAVAPPPGVAKPHAVPAAAATPYAASQPLGTPTKLVAVPLSKSTPLKPPPQRATPAATPTRPSAPGSHATPGHVPPSTPSLPAKRKQDDMVAQLQQLQQQALMNATMSLRKRYAFILRCRSYILLTCHIFSPSLRQDDGGCLRRPAEGLWSRRIDSLQQPDRCFAPPASIPRLQRAGCAFSSHAGNPC
jgi:hypothetical protein